MQPQSSHQHTSWQSVRWPDGSSYEGLVKGDMCHIRGVSKFADGDRYEGEFVDNRMEGLGTYIWHDGVSYMGAWKQDKMHGCGIKLCYDDSGSAVTQAGLFVNDEFAGTSSVCDVPAAQLAAKQAVGAASLACGLESQQKAHRLEESQTELRERGRLVSHMDAFRKRLGSSSHDHS